MTVTKKYRCTGCGGNAPCVLLATMMDGDALAGSLPVHCPWDDEERCEWEEVEE